MLIINADDWGGWKTATDAELVCWEAGSITSVSAMVFMDDSQRAAELARKAGIEAGLHVNFTLAFSAPDCPPQLRQDQDRIRRFLKRNKYAQLLYNPMLRREFQCVYEAQAQEFLRLYGRPPSHINGHQHMHLCTNLLLDKIIPAGTKVRRSFSLERNEKGPFNRAYRRWVDGRLAQRHRLTDYFFALSQSLEDRRLMRIADLARTANVELMTHPEKPGEFACLMSDDWAQRIKAATLGTWHQLGKPALVSPAIAQ